jgi:hypothetical protein
VEECQKKLSSNMFNKDLGQPPGALELGQPSGLARAGPWSPISTVNSHAAALAEVDELFLSRQGQVLRQRLSGSWQPATCSSWGNGGAVVSTMDT